MADCGIISRKETAQAFGVPPVGGASYKGGIIVLIKITDTINVFSSTPSLVIAWVGLEGFFKDIPLLTVTGLTTAA